MDSTSPNRPTAKPWFAVCIMICLGSNLVFRRYRFVADRDRADNLVDDLLASPDSEKGGEGIGWTLLRGYQRISCGRGKPGVSLRLHYRDWVIKALNKHLPYDEFVRKQLADFTDQPNDPHLAALGFLTTGLFFNRRQLIIDDQIDLVTRIDGLTVACPMP